MNNGWIKIHRKLQKKGFAGKPAYFAVWVHLLLEANHKEKDIVFNKTLIKVKRGQILTGRKQLSKLTGVVDTSLERILNYFEKNEHQIGQRKTNRYRLITIYNYDRYQSTDIQTDIQRTSSGHPADTNKNVKNVKNGKKAKIFSKNYADLDDAELEKEAKRLVPKDVLPTRYIINKIKKELKEKK